jgi:diguanylate cyclase (GGDEF)-like protein
VPITKDTQEALLSFHRQEWKRRDVLARTICGCLTLAIVAFALLDIVRSEFHIAAILICTGIFNSIALGLYHHFRALAPFTAYLTLSCSAVSLYLLASGGTQNSGVLWVTLFPVLMFSLHPVRTALAIVAAQFIAVSAVLYHAPLPYYVADYQPYIRIVASASFALITGLSYLLASAREQDSRELSEVKHELNIIASTDELTNLANRREIKLRLEFESKRSARTGKEFSIILINIDYFKRVNDSFGYNIGDQALADFSRILANRFRKTDKVGRWGGEEFLALLPNTTEQAAIFLAEELRKTICQNSLFPNMPNRLITISCGVVSSKYNIEPNELIKQAGCYLRDAKDQGRNRVIPEAIK